jgi:trans-2,3-dihydro-3-hydroxyanthranilate isomerase
LILEQRVQRVALNLQVGQIPVTFDGEMVWMRQNPPDFGETRTPAQVAPVLGLAESDFDERFPIQDVSTGLPFLLIPLKSMDAVKRARVRLDRLQELIAPLRAKMLFIFSRETYDSSNQINARMFGDEFGVVEDPATGSANGCLAAYLVKYRYFGSNEINVQVEQGYEIKRPSILRLRASERDGAFEINVGGKVFLVARGELV